MALNMAEVSLIGYCGRAPETRTIGANTVTEFSVAVSEMVKKGEESKPTWYRCSCWGKLGEIALARIAKGTLVFVRGDLRIGTYVGKDGSTKVSVDVNTQKMIVLETPADAGEAGEAQSAPDTSAPANAPASAPASAPRQLAPRQTTPRQPSATQLPDDEDLPF